MRRQTGKGWRRGGFTLIEMVIVIAIIALLAGIVYAATASAREKGRQTVCVSNLKQIYAAVRMYQDDYHGVEPDGPRSYWELGLPPAPEATELLTPYLKSSQVWWCPNDYLSNRNEIGRSYAGGWYPDVMPIPSVPFRSITARCGDTFPLFECQWHGYKQRIDRYVIMLRYNGQVKGVYLPFPVTLCDY